MFYAGMCTDSIASTLIKIGISIRNSWAVALGVVMGRVSVKFIEIIQITLFFFSFFYLISTNHMKRTTRE
jgi:hypothetical protein